MTFVKHLSTQVTGEHGPYDLVCAPHLGTERHDTACDTLFLRPALIAPTDTVLGAAQTLVSPRNHFLFTPLLPSAVTGTVQLGSIVESVRALLGRASL